MKGLKKLIIFSLLLLFPTGHGLAATKFITIGTGGVTGVYYPTGSAISKLMNQKRSIYGFKVTTEATGGSVFNINALAVGDLDFALSQSDKASQAWAGQEEWTEKGPRKELRGVFCLNSETVCLIASVNRGIKSCADLKGKIVGVGNPGSGTRQNAQDALSTCGLKFRDLAQAEGIKPVEAAALLQDGRLDAYFYTVGHPNGSIKEAAAGGTKVRFIPFPDIEALLLKNPFYSKTSIPVSLYSGFDNSGDVPTFGVKACFLTTDKMADTVVYSITKEVFENFDTFRNLHPSFSDLKKEEMVTGLPVPLHPGALKYYKEVGLDMAIEGR
ncbi:MAG: TAXI family TRAP transporter solute-binding subunit [Desulfomonile sp.]